MSSVSQSVLLWTYLCELKASQVELHSEFQDSYYMVAFKKKERNKKTKIKNRPAEEGRCEWTDGSELRGSIGDFL